MNRSPSVMELEERAYRVRRVEAATKFIRESNHIEGIDREPTEAEIEAHLRFLALDHTPRVRDLVEFVSVFQPGAVLRDREGLNVRVGSHIPPAGGPKIFNALERILTDAHFGAKPHAVHCAYETLHPFTDGNGRSGRMLWLWQMRDAPLGFLHTFYYQTLAALPNRGAQQ